MKNFKEYSLTKDQIKKLKGGNLELIPDWATGVQAAREAGFYLDVVGNP